MQRAKTALQLCMGLNPLLIVLQTNRLVFRSTNFARFPSLPNTVLGIQILDWRCQCYYLTVVTITMPAASLVELIKDCAGERIAICPCLVKNSSGSCHPWNSIDWSVHA